MDGDNKSMKKMTITIPDDLHRQIKARVAMEGKTISSLAAELMSEYLKNLPCKSGK